MGNGYNVKDALLKQTKALPAAIGSVTSTPINLETNPTGDFVAPVQLKLTAPALDDDQLPDTHTAIYDILMDTSASMGSPTVLYNDVITQTGATSAGDVGNSFIFSLPANVESFIAAKCTTTSTAADASAVSLTLEVLL
ncbi:MAG: hypothetical protein WD176_10445 [Pirellulales bacterium]